MAKIWIFYIVFSEKMTRGTLDFRIYIYMTQGRIKNAGSGCQALSKLSNLLQFFELWVFFFEFLCSHTWTKRSCNNIFYWSKILSNYWTHWVSSFSVNIIEAKWIKVTRRFVSNFLGIFLLWVSFQFFPALIWPWLSFLMASIRKYY